METTNYVNANNLPQQQDPSAQQQQQQQTPSELQPQPAPAPAFYRLCGCIECYNPGREVLEYDYTYDDNATSTSKPPQQYPRIRERGEYYIDSFNGEPWSCTFGTSEPVSYFTYLLCPLCTIISYGMACMVEIFILYTSLYCNLSWLYSLNIRMGFGTIAQIKPDPSCQRWCGFSCSIQLSQ